MHERKKKHKQEIDSTRTNVCEITMSQIAHRMNFIDNIASVMAAAMHQYFLRSLYAFCICTQKRLKRSLIDIVTVGTVTLFERVYIETAISSRMSPIQTIINTA